MNLFNSIELNIFLSGYKFKILTNAIFKILLTAQKLDTIIPSSFKFSIMSIIR